MSSALSGCFQPLYGPLGSGGDVASELQAIAVEPIHNRLGHYLGNELIFGFNGTGSQVPAKYRLFVTETEYGQNPLLDTVSGYPSAANVVVNADYRLMLAGGGEPIAKGKATVVASYDRTSQRFSNLRAARNAEIRDAKRLADEIRIRVAAALAARG
ncbi:MAG: LPS assembly lipoprotein LptE [Beijerinckiaceae bacterium]